MTGRIIRTLAPLLLLAVSALDLTAQRAFPWRADINARSLDTLYSPDSTSPRHRYRITAWGTYSMWEDTLNSSVDPVWIYSFPAEEWAKPEWRVFDAYPIYVGDPRLLDAHGFRINGMPFPERPLNPAHRYSAIVQGDGRPISVALVDWNYKNFQKRDAHENNSGWISFIVEELPLYEWEVCAIDSSAFPTIRLSVKVMRDSVRLEDIGDHLGLRENGIPVSIQKVDCSERTGAVSVAMVFDRSGSMDTPFGTGTRMDYTRSAGRSFVDRITPADEAAIYSFSLNTTLDQSWTNDRTLLARAIDRLVPEGWTAMNDAVIRAVDDISLRPAGPRKAIVVLSDGEDNRSQVREISTVIERARRAGVPVFAIGLLLDADDSLRMLAHETGGRYFSVRDPEAMDSVFMAIAELVFEKGCCSVYYTSPDPRRNGVWRSVAPTFFNDEDTVDGSTTGYYAPSGQSSVADAQVNATIEGVVPNPLRDVGALRFALDRPASLTIDVIDGAGRRVLGLSSGSYESGRHDVALNAYLLMPGRYFVRVGLPGSTHIYPMQIVR